MSRLDARPRFRAHRDPGGSLMKNIAIAAAAAVLLSARLAAATVCGDVNDNDQVTASDALGVLKVAVNPNFAIDCGPVGSLLTTGQTFCANVEGMLTGCEGSGQDGEFQTGARRSFKDNGDGTVTDRVTGLMWEKLDSAGGIHDHEIGFETAQAFVKIATLNGTSFAGYTDWRLPNVYEVLSLASYGTSYFASFPEFENDCTDGCNVTACSCNPRYTLSSTTNNANRMEQ